MTEIRGLVKLFGKTFPVPAEGNIPAFSGDEGGGAGKVKDTLSEKSRTESKEKDQTSKKSDDEEGEHPASPTAKENHKPSNENQEEAMPAKASKLQEEEENDARSNSEEKTMKKPDKILPCPRCESLDTKFCYYNNYNVNQPRHFCKNCQRYWTAGGTMRNVPVGAGRRKNKSSSSHYRHLTVSEASLQTVQCDISQVIHHHPLKPNGTVLSFGSDMPPPLCESIFAEKTMRNHSRSGFHHRMEEHMVPFSCGGGEKGELEKSHSSVSSLTATDSISTREGCGSNMPEPESHQGYPPLQIPSFDGSPWPHPWNTAPAFCASGFPISFYPAPAAYWGCAVPGGAWAVPWLSPVTSSSSSSYSSSPNTGSSSPNSPLGKHSRDGCVPKPLPSSNSEKAGDAPEQTNQEGRIWVPKTLRIDDPDEAARSSIWATMGIKNNIADGGVSGGGGGLMFKAFHPKSEDFKNHVSANSHVLHANPAAMSRSLNFQESL